MKKKIKFNEIKEFFVDLANGQNKKIQIEQIVINEMIFVDKSREPFERNFFYESISFTGTLLSWIAVAAVAYRLFFSI